MKRLLAALLAVLLLGACFAGAETETRTFTDSLGRTVTIPAELDRIAPTGPFAQIMLFALCPDRLSGIAAAWDADAEELLDKRYCDLPVLGQLYGGRGELNPETLLENGTQIVIDIGEPKTSADGDLDALQEQTGIPFVHISATTATMGDAFRRLGELTGMAEEAETLASYCEDAYARMTALSESVEKERLLYITGSKGLNVIAKGSCHAEIIDLLSDNAAVVDEPSAKGTGNEVDMEQIMAWNPDVILFAPDSIYDTVGGDESWQSVSAIRSGRYYEVPRGPYNWMGFPPSVQRCLGMLWMGKLLYPEQAEYDLYEEVSVYFSLFCHCALTREQFDVLVENSMGKR